MQFKELMENYIFHGRNRSHVQITDELQVRILKCDDEDIYYVYHQDFYLGWCKTK